MMDTECHVVSTSLCAVLDNIGASEDMRQLHLETAKYIEIVETVINHMYCSDNGILSQYYVGSFYEGTTTLGLENDIDLLMCFDNLHVIDNIYDATERSCLLMAKDNKTKPGYVQLQSVVDGIPQYISLLSDMQVLLEYDDYGRTCFKHFVELTDGLKTRNGPAYTTSIGTTSLDSVYALRCRKVPNSANSWIHRKRQYDWPSQKQVQKMKTFGCFLVGVAHPNSNNRTIEWRISFSLQERELMSGLNPTQHKCYILLKMIKKDLIEPITGKSISSYHCKTCLFYTIETSESSIWTPENLILCTRKCLERLLSWSKNGNCPNYFIPEENMFDKLDREKLEIVNTELTNILSSEKYFLFCLKCDNIGRRLFKHLRSGMPINKRDTHKYLEYKLSEYKYKMRFVFSYYNARNFILKIIPAESNEGLFILNRCLTHLQEINQVTEHSTKDVRMALSYFIPHIHLQIAQSMASVEIRQRGTNDLVPLGIILNIIESSPAGSISARLSLAACYIKFGMLETCGQLLLAVETSLKAFDVSFCDCNVLHLSVNKEFDMKLLTDSNQACAIKEFIEHKTTGCLVFLQSQANFVYPALQYEMYRSVYTADGSRNENKDYMFDWVVVDPMVYLYFLQYIFCTEKNKPEHRRHVVAKLRHTINNLDTSLDHRETAYNVLGWMLKQENRAIEAWECFCWSWRMKPFHNAAKWHIILLLNDIIR